MLTALVDLVVDAGKCGPADTIFAVIVVDSQYRVTRLVTDLFDTVSRESPDRIFPVVFIFERNIVEFLLPP